MTSFLEDRPIKGKRFAGNNRVGEVALHQGSAGLSHSGSEHSVGGECRDRLGQRVDVVRRH